MSLNEAGRAAPDDRRYTREHLWVLLDEAGQGVIGITDFAQEQLGEIVYAELPPVGAAIHQDQPFGVVESVKTVSDLPAPVSGRVIERNDALTEAAELINTSPYTDGWLIRLTLSERAEFEALLDAAAYKREIAGL